MLFAVTSYFPFVSSDIFEIRSYEVKALDNQITLDISTYYFIVPMALAAAISLFAIFLYSNRQRQMATVRVTFILYAISFALMALCIKDSQKLLTNNDQLSLGIAFFSPFLSLLLNLLALRAIRKDDKLVKSVDRIR
jgi:Kef-type K+ transport system membrane component KefB